MADALAENGARMTRVIEALRALGNDDKDIQTSEFAIQPKYETLPQGQYDYEAFRQITGYYVSNSVVVSVTDMAKIAKIIDATVQAGANDSGKVEFRVKNLTKHMDDARRAAVENAYHKALVLAEASHTRLGPALSVTDNQADFNYNNNAHGALVETVVVTGARMPTPILAGQISMVSDVTVLYSAR